MYLLRLQICRIVSLPSVRPPRSCDSLVKMITCKATKIAQKNHSYPMGYRDVVPLVLAFVGFVCLFVYLSVFNDAFK